jgi:hypothetical protein
MRMSTLLSNHGWMNKGAGRSYVLDELRLSNVCSIGIASSVLAMGPNVVNLADRMGCAMYKHPNSLLPFAC